jgi:chemotaxis methyl-accepting protein methylase
MTSSDPFRADAAIVWRALRDSGTGLSAKVLADRCFPLEFGHDDPLYERLVKRSIRRVFDSLVWMRHEGVVLTAVPTPEGETQFVLGHVAVAVTPFVRDRDDVHVVVTPEVALPERLRETKTLGEGMDVWHGK